LTWGGVLPKNIGVDPQNLVILLHETVLKREEAVMPSCPECENNLDVELDEVEEGDVVTCEECGNEYEVVGVEPLELARVDADLIEDDEPFAQEEEEE
jgi:alpha-aminoadipate/glutamate carrier protein LysW